MSKAFFYLIKSDGRQCDVEKLCALRLHLNKDEKIKCVNFAIIRYNSIRYSVREQRIFTSPKDCSGLAIRAQRNYNLEFHITFLRG